MNAPHCIQFEHNLSVEIQRHHRKKQTNNKRKFLLIADDRNVN